MMFDACHRYSYSMDELKCQLDQLGEYAEDYTVWRQKVQEVLSMKSSKPGVCVCVNNLDHSS